MDSLLVRLEAALGRLEAAAPVRSTDERLEAAVSRLESILSAGTLAAAPSAAPSAPAPASAPRAAAPSASSPSVVAFKKVVDEYLPRIKAAAAAIGDSLELSVEQLEKALAAEERTILAISQCKKPAMDSLQKLVAPLGDALAQANKLTDGKRKSTFNHSKATAESLQALTWVLYTEKGCGLSLPGPHIDETWPSAEFYTNKILVENKNKDGGAPHVEFAKALKELYTKGLKEYVKQFHLQGPSWSANGIEVDTFLQAPSATAAGPKAPPPPPKGAPPPPPPGGGPPALQKAAGGGAKSGAQDMTQVFAQLNQGAAVTSGLRKVTADMKTKNRTDRSGLVPSGPGAGVVAKDASPAKPKTGGTPKFELQQDRKWVVEYQVGQGEVVIKDTSPKQTVYIFSCKDSVIQVQGKVNAITLDKCTKTAIVFKDVVASCEVVNCTSVEVQCQGTAPSLSVDNTSGCQLYLSATALGTSITTAKSSEVNVLVPGPTAEDNMVEFALPEQFVNEYKDGKFHTTPISHAG